jgi:WD40 repeat protein
MTNRLKAKTFDTGSEVVSPLIEVRHSELPANATACAITDDGATCAVSLGDGAVSLLDLAALNTASGGHGFNPGDIGVKTIRLHNVAAVGIAAIGKRLVSVGQDGRAVIFNPSSPEAASILFEFKDAWIEAVAVNNSSELVGLASGRRCVVVRLTGEVLADVDVGSTVTDLHFDNEGKRIAASHYNGVTVISTTTGKPDLKLEWKGSHIGISLSPSSRYIVTATQEKELHVWDLVTMKDFRIGGYPRKCHEMAWTADGDVLVCSGADVITAWSFAGSGPAGRPPLEIGFVFGGTVCAVAAHPDKSLVAGGFTTGNVLIGATSKGEAAVAKASDGYPVTCLSWSPTGKVLAAGTRAGKLSLFGTTTDLNVR